MLLSLYHSNMKSRKWYHRIVVHLVFLALVNFFTAYRQIGGTWSLLDFQLDIFRCFLKADQSINSDEDVANPVSISRSFSANQVPVPVHHNRENHWPIKYESVNRCKQSGCTKCTRFICLKCQIYLYVLSDCFINFHGVEQLIVLHFNNLYADFADELGFVLHFPINLYQSGKKFVVVDQ